MEVIRVHHAADDPVRPSAEITLADLTEAVAHEFNNCLNSIMLHLAIVEQWGNAADLPKETASIRRKIFDAAQMIAKLQQFSEREVPKRELIDLNNMLRDLADKQDSIGNETHQRPAVNLDLAADLPPLAGSSADLQRLIALLLEHAACAIGDDGGTITVRTRSRDDSLELCIEDTGPPVAEDDLGHLFTPFAAVRGGQDGVRLAVCKALARRLNGSLRGDNRPEGGMAFIAEFPAEKSIATVPSR
jgi:signal transduction histidine kinase